MTKRDRGAYMREWRANNKERIAAYRGKPEAKKRAADFEAEYKTRPEVKQRRREKEAARRKTPERKQYRSEYMAKYNAEPANKQRQAERVRHRKYDLLPVEYNFMLAGQGFRCAACGTYESGPKGRDWNVDHCHDTGKVRGILCHWCNTGIGSLGDNVAGLRRAIAYLERFECQTNSTPPTSETAGPMKASPPIAPNAKPQPNLRLVLSSPSSSDLSRKSA